MKNLILIASLFLVSISLAETKIYKKVDKDGNVTYTDQKPSENAKEVELTSLTIVESSPVEKPIYNKTRVEEKPVKENFFANFKITQPSQEQTVSNTGGALNVAVSINGELPKNYGIKFFVDSSEYPIVNSNSTTIDNIIRGEHQVYAQAINLNSNTVIKTTPKVTFFMRQHVKKR